MDLITFDTVIKKHLIEVFLFPNFVNLNIETFVFEGLKTEKFDDVKKKFIKRITKYFIHLKF